MFRIKKLLKMRAKRSASNSQELSSFKRLKNRDCMLSSYYRSENNTLHFERQCGPSKKRYVTSRQKRWQNGVDMSIQVRGERSAETSFYPLNEAIASLNK